jgi:acetylornithine deacetylase/succinyl-diaminopimelate desuccinylase-like protein
VLDLLRKHLDKHGFNDIEIKYLGGYPCEISDVTAPILQAASRACQRVHAQEPVIELLSPGSGPMYSLGTFIGGVPVVCVGTGHSGARVHSPNEHQLLKNYYDGMRYFGVFIEEFAK